MLVYNTYNSIYSEIRRDDILLELLQENECFNVYYAAEVYEKLMTPVYMQLSYISTESEVSHVNPMVFQDTYKYSATALYDPVSKYIIIPGWRYISEYMNINTVLGVLRKMINEYKR